MNKISCTDYFSLISLFINIKKLSEIILWKRQVQLRMNASSKRILSHSYL